jgi:hypothetical protein
MILVSIRITVLILVYQYDADDASAVRLNAVQSATRKFRDDIRTQIHPSHLNDSVDI